MKRSDLFREYARVIDMCEGTEVHTFSCIRLGGHAYRRFDSDEVDPVFECRPEDYDFALAIVEGKPVFKGDEVYLKDGRKYDWNGVWMGQIVHHLTWTKPRTFTLNGEVLPCPRAKEDINWSFGVGSRAFHFDSMEKRDQVLNAILKMLTDAENS